MTCSDGVMIRLLGPVDLAVGGQPTPIPQRAQRIVLAMLAVEANRVVPAGTLIDALWQLETSQQWVRNLHTHIHRLRGRLNRLGPAPGTARIVTQPPGYQLVLADGGRDLDVFRQGVARARGAERQGAYAIAADHYRHALALWRGPALADLTNAVPRLGRDAQQLEELRLTVVEERLEAELAAGLDGDLAGELAGLVSQYPFRDRFRRQLMLCLYRCGRRSDALIAYQDARRVFREELGLDPGGDLQELHRQILAGAPELARPGPPVADLAPPASQRDRPGEEVIAIRLGAAELGHLDSLVKTGRYGDRTEFVQSAVRSQLSKHSGPGAPGQNSGRRS
jgi:DNA-binding SARP family transcriptional activator